MFLGSSVGQGHQVHESKDKQTVPVSVLCLFSWETWKAPNLSL